MVVKMIKGLATIILPIYKVEKYLDRCINSIINQTYKNLEIILVDDGSPDRCPQMCEEWAKKDSRIKVVHKENAGLGMARNTGIEHAVGEYIFFIDSDDYVELNTVEKVFQVAEQTGAELIMYGHKDVDRQGNIKDTIIPYSEKEYFEGEEIQNTLIADMVSPIPGVSKNGNIWMSACMSAYKYSLIHRTGYRFVSERELISEDVYSLLCLMKDVKSVAIIPEAFYIYCENGASLTHTYRSDRYPRIKELYNACVEKCDEMGYEPVVKERFAYVYMANTIAALKIIAKADLTIKEKWKNVNEIVNDELMQKIIRQISIKNESSTRRMLFYAILHRFSNLVYWMAKIKL